MPTEQDIIRARALSELAEAFTRRDARKAEAANARLTALSAIPAVGEAVAAHDEVVRTAEAALGGEVEEITRLKDAAEIAAHTKRSDDDVVVMQTLQDDNANAHAAHAEAVAEAERVFAEDFRAAGQLVGADADRARKAANTARQKALDLADRTRRKALDTANTTMERALLKNFDVSTAAVNAAQLTAIAETATAEERRTKAVRTAGTALKKALATTPAAAAVEREFAASLRQLDEQHKADESAILDRMHRDLEALSGGTS